MLFKYYSAVIWLLLTMKRFFASLIWLAIFPYCLDFKYVFSNASSLKLPTE